MTSNRPSNDELLRKLREEREKGLNLEAWLAGVFIALIWVGLAVWTLWSAHC